MVSRKPEAGGEGAVGPPQRCAAINLPGFGTDARRSARHPHPSM